MTRDEKIQEFATLLETEQNAQMDKQGYTHHRTCPGIYKARVRPGKKYTKVDFGGSGKYMIEDEMIFGIKAYGVIHRGHCYGTLDTIHDWYWGGYTAVPVTRTGPG